MFIIEAVFELLFILVVGFCDIFFAIFTTILSIIPFWIYLIIFTIICIFLIIKIYCIIKYK